jgi:chromate transporter
MLVRQGRLWLAWAVGLAVMGSAAIWWLRLDITVVNSVVTSSSPQPASNRALTLSGLRTGLLTFGGAYSAIGFLRHDAVNVGG